MHEVEPSNPSLDEAWEQEAADALAELYASDGAGLSRRAPDDPEFRARLARVMPPGSIGEEIDLARSEDRTRKHGEEFGQNCLQYAPLALERRFDQLEQRIGLMLGDLATRSEVAGLKLLEGLVRELLAHAEEARTGFARVLSIESRLAELTAAREDQASRLLAAAMPTEQELTRFSEAAAEKAVQRLARLSGQDETSTVARAAGLRTDERLTQLRDMLAEFADERRRNEQHVADALDTMQEAMERILDRVDGIEAEQREVAVDPILPQAVDGGCGVDAPRHAPEPYRWTSLEDAKAAARTAAAAVSARSAAISALGREPADISTGARSHTDGDREAWAAKARRAAQKASEADGTISVDGAITHPQHAGAPDKLMRQGPLLVASLVAFLMAGFWLATGSKLRPATDVAAPSSSRLVSQSDRGHVDMTMRSAAPDLNRLPSGQADPERATPDQARRSTSEGSAALSGRSPELGAGSVGVIGQGIQGISVEQSDVVLSPDDLMRVRQKQRMANLSSRVGRQAAETFAGTPGGGDLVTGATGQIPANGHDLSRSMLELPPLSIGPHSLRLAAAQGDASAQFEVAARFAEGKGVKQDFEQAGVWYRRSAEQGLAPAQYRLATLYERDLGVKGDAGQARIWYQRAAEQGNVKAMHNLAVLSAARDAAAPDYPAAARWFGEAAEHGLADSQYNLGILYENGLGVPKNPATAYKWYALAAMSGDKEALRRRDMLKAKFDAAVLKAADRQIEEWQARPIDPIVNEARVAGEAWKARAPATSG